MGMYKLQNWTSSFYATKQKHEESFLKIQNWAYSFMVTKSNKSYSIYVLGNHTIRNPNVGNRRPLKLYIFLENLNVGIFPMSATK